METLNKALIACVTAGGGSKKVGAAIWPDLAPDQAQRKLLNALDEHRAEKLSPTQVLLILKIARSKGFHEGIGYILADLGYAPPQPIEPRDEMAELQRQFIETQTRMADMLGRMERLQGVQHFPTLRAA